MEYHEAIERDAKRLIRNLGKQRALDKVDDDRDKSANTAYAFSGHPFGELYARRAEYLRQLFNKISTL